MEQVFQFMDYKGKPPAKVEIISEMVRLSKSLVTEPEEQEYFDMAEHRGHYGAYDYESEAVEVQTKVLNWWFREKEELPFTVALT